MDGAQGHISKYIVMVISWFGNEVKSESKTWITEEADRNGIILR
jgi:hypothetical protein